VFAEAAGNEMAGTPARFAGRFRRNRETRGVKVALMEVDSSPMGGAAMGWWDNEGVNVRIFQSR